MSLHPVIKEAVLRPRRIKPYPGWRFRLDAYGNLHHEPKLWARIVKRLTGKYPGEKTNG